MSFFQRIIHKITDKKPSKKTPKQDVVNKDEYSGFSFCGQPVMNGKNLPPR